MPAASAFILAGGGTGGHIYPNVAIAEELAALAPGARFRFLVSDRAVDAEILREQRIDGRPAAFTPLPARPFVIRPKPLLALARQWRRCVGLSRDAIRSVAEEAGVRPGDVTLVATGGFVSAPAVRAAAIEGCRRVLVNLDAAPGLANRYAASRCDGVFTAAAVPDRPGWTLVPPIYRRDAIDTRPPAEARRELGLDPDRPTLLVTGASQGARSLNALVLHILRAAPDLLAGWQLIHQTGAHRPGDPPELAPDALREAAAGAGVPAIVEPFFHRMGPCWRAAHLAISRAGAGSVAEAYASGVRTLFFPYPYHKDQHQRLNAKPLADSAQALILDDLIDPERNLNRHRDTLVRELAAPTKAEATPSDGPEPLRLSGSIRVARAILHAR